jgi:septum formation protein
MLNFQPEPTLSHTSIMPSNLPLPVILASESPRRREILTQLGLRFCCEASGIEEGLPRTGEQPRAFARRLAVSKAAAAAVRHPQDIIIAADTLVVKGSTVLGKPADRAEAATMLRLLSGRHHEVVTGICLRDGHRNLQVSGSAITQVKFRRLSASEIAAYVASDEPRDKAGAYAIQERAALFVEEIRGCYFNVVGFPVALFFRLWARLRLPPMLG